MDPVEPWIDADAVRRMAEQLLTRPVETSIVEQPDAGFGPGFEGFTAVGERPIPEEPQVRPFVQGPGAPPEQRPEPEPQPQPPPPPAESSGPPSEAVIPQAAAPRAVEVIVTPGERTQSQPASGRSPATPPPLPGSPERPLPGAIEDEFKPLDAEDELTADQASTESHTQASAQIPAEVEAEPEAPVQAPPEPQEPVEEPVEESVEESVEERGEESPFRRVESRPETEEPAGGELVARLARFRDSLCHHSGAKGVFILDREGEPVIDDPAFAKLHFLAKSLAQAYRPVEGQAGNVHVKIGADSYLVVIPVDTTSGCLVLGTVLGQPFDAAAVDVVSKALVKAVEG